jgi:hypothetical protein
MPAKAKILKQLSTVYLVRDLGAGGGSTTINGAGAAKGQAVVPVAATANLTAGDTVRIGAGEELELGVISSVSAGVSITLADNLTYDHAVGEAVVEQVAYDLGDVTDGGVTTNAAAQTTDVATANRRLVYTVLNGNVDLTAEFALPGFTPFALAVACGLPLSAISGTGTASAPLSLATDGSDFGAEQNQSLIVIGLTQDGSAVRVELWGVDFDYTGISVQLRRGQLASVPVKAVAAAGGVVTTNASAYVANTSQRPGKGKVFDALAEVGLFADATTGPLATTSTAPVAAGATVVPFTAVTNLVAGDWVKVASGETVEFHRVESIATLNVTFKTKLLRAQASGVALVRQQLVSFGGVHEDGATLSVGGSVEPIRLANKRMSAGLKLGSATTALAFGVVDLTLANFARALGIPQSAIASNRLPIGANIGTATVEGLYVRGVQQDGATVWVNVWGCAQDVSAFALALAQTGVARLPISLKPSSGLHLLQHA